MKKLGLLIFSLLIGSSLFSQNMMKENNGLIITKSKHGFEQTLEKLRKILKEKNLIIFAEFDHQKNAKEVGLTMPSATVVVFGNPNAGTKIMVQDPYVSLELPMKISIVEAKNKNIEIVFADPQMLSSKYNLKDSPITKKMSALMKDIVSSINK